MLWYCCFAFRWWKDHFKKSPRSKSPATMEHNRALSIMQRSYRRYKLPRTVSSFFKNYCQRVCDSCQQFAICTMFSHALFYLNSTAIPWYRSYDNAHFTGEKTNIQKRKVTLSKLTQLLNAGDRIWTHQYQIGFELCPVSNPMCSTVAHCLCYV